MKNILIITAHPTAHNLSKGIAKLWKEEKEIQGHEVEIIDLYQDKALPFLSFESQKDLAELSDIQKYYQEKITKADEIIFVYPFWWGSIPAILKNFLDSILLSGFAFKYGSNGMPEGLLKGKSVRVFSTSGAPTWLYCLNGIRKSNKKIWKQTIAGFCGMKFDGYHLFGGMDTKSKKVDKMFACVKKIAHK
ncbi:NAD(P)H oxidoreductase YRKL @ Putative NADPH-quinone reductase (modulator of drug activity B) @ Flavodoxin 2 [hydrothermal vent metagenome]|uniref:NAD(P)H oxidoreductase YRKL @ Putative NADPH-quinone reductase (Modulator of drug activity B) @ Flavodoxin 2 n=1 Tax=hydrothermal vent metagenome TaxID=652676 RepID=A0A1W1CYV1_9ZZZZ